MQDVVINSEQIGEILTENIGHKLSEQIVKKNVRGRRISSSVQN